MDFYVEGGMLGPAAWEDPEPCGSAALLQIAQREVDSRLIRIVTALDGHALSSIVRVHRGSQTQHEHMDRLLLHLFQHQIHHRGQAHAMMSGTSVSPPQLDDFFSAAEAPLRTDDLAGLGWTEEAVWSDPS